MLWWTLCYVHCFDSLDLGLDSTLLTNEMRGEMTTNHKMVSQPAICIRKRTENKYSFTLSLNERR